MVRILQIKDSWSLSFFWRPGCSSREIHGDLPIALIKAVDGSYLEIKYDGANDQFEITDGTDSVTLATDGWKFEDTVKFVLVHYSGYQTSLWVETPVEGRISVGSGPLLGDAVHYCQFSADSAGNVDGVGAFGAVRWWDSAFDQNATIEVLNLVPTAIKPTIESPLLFSRDSEAYGDDLEEKDSGEVLADTLPVFTRPEPDFDDSVTESRRFRFAHDGVAYCSNGTTLYKTTDGLSYETEVDLGSIDSRASVSGGAALSDGTFLVSARSYDTNDGAIWRRDPDTKEWSRVHTMDGFGSFFSWTGISGDEIALGEYTADPQGQQDAGTGVHYSPDRGKTWTKIYTRPGKTEGDQLHIHCVAFAPGDTDTIYIAYGDGEFRGIHKIVCTDPADKANSASWQLDSVVTVGLQPTSVLEYNGKLYWGHDGDGRDAAIIEHDPADDSFTDLYRGPVRINSDADLAYDGFSVGIDFWQLKRINGLFYAAGYQTTNVENGGLYVSDDLRNWTRIFTGDGEYDVQGVGFDGSRIWIDVSRADGTQVAHVSGLPYSKRVEFVRARRQIENLYDSANSVFSDGDLADWSLSGGYDAARSGYDTARAFVGEGCLRVAADDTGGYLTARGPLVPVSNGDYLLLSAWVYVPQFWENIAADGKDPAVLLWDYASDNIKWGGAGYVPVLVPGKWHRVKLWGRATADTDVQVRFLINGLDEAPEPSENYEVWIDCVQLVKFSDLHYSGSFQLGQRAAEHLIAPAAVQCEVNVSSFDEQAVEQLRELMRSEQLSLAAKVMLNKAVQDKVSGEIVYYDDDGQTPVLRHRPTDEVDRVVRDVV